MVRYSTRELPAHNGVTALAAALSALDPSVRYARLMADCGGVARTSACACGGLCAERRAAAAWLPAAGVAGFRLRWVDGAATTPSALRRRIDRALAAGRPVAWFRPDDEGVLLGATPTAGRYAARSVGWSSGTQEVEIDARDLGSARLCFPRRTRAPKGLRRDRDVAMLVEWVAEARRPPIAGGCCEAPAPALAAVGLAAFDVWADALTSATGRRRPAVECARVRAQLWLDAYRSAAEVLNDLAGRSGDPYHRRLRQASGAASAVVSRTLEPLHAACCLGALRGAPALLRAGLPAAREVAALVAEAAWLGGPQASGLQEVLLGQTEAPLVGAALHEVIYLARAGTCPYRQLAALRLAGSSEPQARATLQQLLYDPDGPVSECALWSLTRTAPDTFGLYASAFRSVGRERARTDLPLQTSLLHAALASGDPRADDLLAEALQHEDAAVRRWAGRLVPPHRQHDRP